MGAPTLVSYTDTGFTTGGAGHTTGAAVSRNNGDLLVFIAGSEGPDALSATNDSVNGITWTTQKSNSVANTCGTMLATAVASSTASATISGSNGTNSSDHWGFSVWVFRNTQGVGNSAEQHTSTKTVSLTPTAADGAICYAVFDFAAGALGSLTPSPSDSRQAAVDSGHYTFYVGDLTDQSSAGAVSYGVTGTSSTGAFSILAFEVKNSGTTSSVFEDDSHNVKANLIWQVEPIISVW